MNRLYTNKIVIHHSVTPQKWDRDKTVDLVKRSHLQRGLAYDGNIAYHFLIGKDWTYQGRPLYTVGYHAGHWLTNLSSVALCLTGNFNVDTPTEYQEKELARLVGQVRKRYSNAAIVLHRDVRSTACPGYKITKDYIEQLIRPVIERVNEALRECGDNPSRSVGTLTLSRWWQKRTVADPIKFTNDEEGYRALVNAIKWHQENHKYPHDNA